MEFYERKNNIKEVADNERSRASMEHFKEIHLQTGQPRKDETDHRVQIMDV
jgi:hypothetical protein